MDRVKNALTRKFGPLPAWAWFLILGVAYWYYENKIKTNSVSGTGTGSVSPTPTSPQSPVTLSPGESVYNPNTGSLATAPGGGAAGGGGPGSITSAINNLANALESPASPVPSTSTGDNAKKKKATKRKPKNRFSRKGEHRKKRHEDHKPHKKRGRSDADVRNDKGGRTRGRKRKIRLGALGGPTTSHTGQPGLAKPSNPVAARRLRDRPKTGTYRRVVHQRPVASHQPPAKKESPQGEPQRKRETRRRRKRH